MKQLEHCVSTPLSVPAAFERHYERLLVLAQRWVHCQADAEDAVQTVFLRLVVKGTITLPTEREFGYLLVAVRREAQRLQSRQRRMAPLDQVSLIALATALGFEGEPHGSSPTLRSGPDLDQYRSVLSPVQRRIVDALLAGGSLREAAADLGVSVNTAKTQYRRAREKILSLAERERERERVANARAFARGEFAPTTKITRIEM